MATLPSRIPTPDATPAASDLLYKVNDPYGTPSDDATTIGNAVTKGHGLSGANALVKLGATDVLEESVVTENNGVLTGVVQIVGSGNIDVAGADVESGTAGIAALYGGNGIAGDANGGDVIIQAGDKDGSGTAGSLRLRKADGTHDTTISFASLTADRTLTLPDADGTVALDATVVKLTGAQSVAGVKTFSDDPLIPDEAYGSGWNGVLEPPTKNAVYDKIESLSSGQTLVTHIVAASGGTHTTLQAALAAASSGDTIWVREGTYALAANTSTSLANLTIIGEGTKSIIDQAGFNLNFNGNNTRIFNLANTATTGYILLNGKECHIDSCYLQSSSNGRQVYMNGGAGTERQKVTNCYFYSTASTAFQNLTCDNEHALIANNHFYLTGSSSGGVIRISSTTGKYVQIQNNNIYLANENSASNPVIYTTADYTLVEGNMVRCANDRGILVEVNARGYASIQNNTVVGLHGLANMSGGCSTFNISDNTGFITSGSGTGYGVSMGTTAFDGVISGNMLTGVGGTTGILVANGADNIVITGNRIKSFGTGVSVAGSNCDKTVIVGNSFVGNSTPISDSGTGTVNSGNAT